MLKKLSSRFAYSHELITKNILWYFLGVFIGARIFYVIAKWSELKYIANPFEFFISNDYNFSLM
jgi:prolipoprotein diacylglyceryltransferase